PNYLIRPTWLRTLDPARFARRKHDLGPRRGYGTLAHPSWRAAMASVRRLVGLDVGACLCRDLPGPSDGACAERHLHASPLGARMVLPGGLELDLSRRVRGLRKRDYAGGARRHDCCLPPSPHPC